MPTPAELINLPQALSEILVRQRTDYERAVRALRWGELPIWALGSAQSLPAAEALRFVFEDLVAWPVIVCEASSFMESAAGILRPGSVVVVFADTTAATGHAARAARKRGAQVLVIGDVEPPAAESSSAPAGRSPALTLALPSAGAAAESGLGAACLQHAAAAQLALVCALQLTRPEARLERMERDWCDLPAHLDRLIGRVGDGVAALAVAMESVSLIVLAGSGYYCAAALRASALSRQQTGRLVVGLDLSSLESGWLRVLDTHSAVLLVSGSAGRGAKGAADLAGSIKERASILLAITGSNDHDLIRQARLSLILPEVGDLARSILALAVAGWVGSSLAVEPGKRSRRLLP
jgi:fructoselysine-6-P-deglycase FrlB-like protein